MKGNCTWCGESVRTGEQHHAYQQEPMHVECGMRAAIGSVGHLLRRCSCFCPGAGQEDPPNLSKREAALAAFLLWDQIEAWYGCPEVPFVETR